MDNIGVKESLALLYVKSLDLNGKTPEYIAEQYDKAYNEISAKLSEIEAARTTSIEELEKLGGSRAY